MTLLKNRILITACAAALLVVQSACTKRSGDADPEVDVQAATAKAGEIEQIVSAEAILFPLHQAAITPKVTAPVKKFYVNRGSRVKAGQLLAELENRDLSAAAAENKGTYEQAQAAYKTATAGTVPQDMQKAALEAQAAKETFAAQQKVLDSRQELYKQGALPRKDLDQASVALVQSRAQYEIAQKHLEAMQSFGQAEALKSASGQLTSAKGKYQGASAMLGYSEIRSPIDGVVTDRPLYPGETAAAGTPLLTVMDTSQVVARAHIPQEQAALIKTGDTARINTAEAGEVAGKVVLVSPALDPNSTTVEVWIQAPNREGKLRPGSTVQVSMVAKTVKDAIVIPTVALLTSSDGTNTVMLAGSDGRAHQQAVKAGIHHGDVVQIVEGLKDGDRVVSSGAYGLPEKTKIKIVEAAQKDKPEAGAAAPAEKN